MRVNRVDWHALTVDEVLNILKTKPQGLDEDEAERRLALYGPNELRREKGRSRLIIFLNQFKNVLILILLIATGLSIVIGEILDAALIITIVIVSAVLGAFQEYRAERALEALRKLTAPEATVIRSGVEKRVLAREIVPGDILVLMAGDRVPADARVFESHELKLDESSLTGESTTVTKIVDPLPEDVSLADRLNMVYAGTVVVYGKGKAVVVATGMNTEMGKIAEMVQEVEKEKTPLEKRTDQIGKILAYLCLSVAILVAGIGFFVWHYDLLTMAIWAVSLAIAAVPEALPAVVTGALAIGMYAMARKNAIVRKLPAVETLGCTTIICSDKTGTMTKGEMTVRKIFLKKFEDELIDVTGAGYEPKGEFRVRGNPVNPLELKEMNLLLLGCLLCNDARLEKIEDRWIVRGDPTEGALKVLSRKAGLTDEIESSYPRIDEVPFSSERKRMTTFHKAEDGKIIAFMKGAPEVILSRCSTLMVDGRIIELSEDDVKKILQMNDEMASKALRNLALAYKVFEEIPERVDESIERGFIFLGIVGMIDPPRPEVKEALELCRRAGIKVVMITGDHKLTALAIAKELKIFKDGDIALTGKELASMSDEELEEIVERVTVYARVSPRDKMKIVKALKKRGHVVAMTGDGVNDAPALKSADIGVAMGITGTEVAKEASDMVLSDDNFATIVSAVEEGRRIYDDIKKYLFYLLGCNISEILIPLFASFMGLPLPFTALQYLWINLTTDGLPAMALGIDPAEPDVMQRPPRDPKESIVTKRDALLFLTFLPLLTTIAILLNFVEGLRMEPLVRARTRIFTLMIIIELLIAISFRSLKYSAFRVGIHKNKFLILAIISSLLMQLCILYVPILHEPFKVTYPTIQDWAMGLISALLVFISVEIVKEVASRVSKTQTDLRNEIKNP
ncbi:MAG TPA: cation-translocating P-type ATPase [Nitrososphaeria archaeon]|nr:cation-translocating P-type ATPase [Nitrososphaeria archaeon]